MRISTTRVLVAPILGVILATTALAQSKSGDALGQATAAAERDLAASLQELAQLRETIKNEKLPLSADLGRAEAKLAALKREFEEQSRSQDTKAIELGNLQAAMKLRQDESTYVANLLDEFTNGFESSLHVSEVPKYKPVIEKAKLARDDEDLSTTDKLSRRVDLMRLALDRLMDLVGGTRYDGQAVDAQGTVANGEFAMVGPVVMFAAKGGTPSGLAIP